MTVTDPRSGTNVNEVAERIYRINTPVHDGAAGFSFNQYLVVAEEPLLFHTGPRQIFPMVRAAVEHVLPAARLRYIAFSHVEADECGSLNQWLAAAPHAVPLCSAVAAMTSIEDQADRKPRVLADGETFDLGGREMQWIDAPHVPHGWECGFIFEQETKTLFCGDLFTQPGTDTPPLTEGDILTPSEAFRRAMDYYAHGPNTGAVMERLATLKPQTLACMHGSAWRGDGAALLRALASALKT
jgi:flavorubredoxin